MTNDSIKVLGLADDRLRGGRVSDDTLIALAGRPDTFHPRLERDRRTSARISPKEEIIAYLNVRESWHRGALIDTSN